MLECSLETTHDISCTKLGVIPKDTHCCNHARTHVYDLLGFYHKEKCSTLMCDLVWNASLT